MLDVTTVERDVAVNNVKISAKDVQVFYGDNHAIKDVTVEIEDKTVTAFIGPSGCGKSTFLRCTLVASHVALFSPMFEQIHRNGCQATSINA